MPSENRWSFLSLIFIYFSACFFCGNILIRSQSVSILVTFSSFFLTYLGILRLKDLNINTIIGLGIVTRLALFFILPSLSDDFYRFYWDGILSNHNINPFSFTPSEIENMNLDFIPKGLFTLLNSPDYYSVYPPTNQLIFRIASLVSDSPLGFVNSIRSLIIIAEILSVYFLIRLKLPSYYIALLFLNPLVILEGVGNIHFEPIVLSLLIGSIFLLKSNKRISSGIALGFAAGLKLLPLIFIPSIFLKNLSLKNSLILIGISIALVFSFFPLIIDNNYQSVSDSLALYFQKFEFNASIYFIIRKIGFTMKGYNIINDAGPWLGFSSFVLILSISVLTGLKKIKLVEAWLWILTIYLLLSTTVHPWYIIPLIGLGILSGYIFPVIWSFFIFLTYLGYTNESYEQNFQIILIEYIVVYMFIGIEIYTNHVKKYSLLHTNHQSVL